MDSIKRQILFLPDSLDARERLDDGGLSVGYVADGSDVDGGLARDDLGAQRRQLGHVERGQVLPRQVRLVRRHSGELLLADRHLEKKGKCTKSNGWTPKRGQWKGAFELVRVLSDTAPWYSPSLQLKTTLSFDKTTEGSARECDRHL